MNACDALSGSHHACTGRERVQKKDPTPTRGWNGIIEKKPGKAIDIDGVKPVLQLHSLPRSLLGKKCSKPKLMPA